MPEFKPDETFKVVDRRLFTEEGEFRKDIAEQQDREQEAASILTSAQTARSADPAPQRVVPPAGSAPGDGGSAAPAGTPVGTVSPKRSTAFENLVRSIGQNAAMLLGGYADPQTGQPMLDLDGAREMIDMLDAIREKTRGNLAPEEDALVVDVLGNLKLAFMEMTKAAAAAAGQDKSPIRK